jgi:hypothetical protein
MGSKVMERNKYIVIDILFIIIIATIFTLKNISVGELYGTDTCQHAMTGIFISDFLKDGVFLKSIKDMWEYTWNYYAHYPAIGLIHWPPLFHLIEGFYFIFFRVSEPVARFLIYLFYLVGIIFYYKLIYKLYGRLTSFISSIFYITSPILLEYSNVVSLEIPSLTISIIAIYTFNKYINLKGTVNAVIFALCTALALLTKQTTIFLLLFYSILYAIIIVKDKDYRLINLREIVAIFVLIGLLVVPYYYLSIYLHGDTIMKDVFKGMELNQTFWGTQLFYIFKLPDQISLLSLIFLILYLVISVVKPRKYINNSSELLLSWAGSCYLVFTLISMKDERYIIYGIPALLGLAGESATETIKYILPEAKRGLNKIKYLVVLLIACISFGKAWTFELPYTNGYNSVAQYLTSLIPENKKEIFLYDGNDHGNFTFSVRKYDKNRQAFVFRSSKYLFAHNIVSEYGLWNIRNSKEEIINFLKKYNIKYIIMSFSTEDDLPVIRMLRDLVKEEERFKFLKRFYVINKDYGRGYIYVYLFKETSPKNIDREIEIPMPSLGKTIKIKLKDLVD